MKMLFACCGTLLVLLSSCAKDKDSAIREIPASLQSESLHRTPVTGSVEAKILEIQAHKWASKCDTENRELKLEIARELDNRAEEIAKFSAQAITNAADLVNIGSAQFTQSPELPLGKPGWQSDRSGWKKTIDLYEKIKGTPSGNDWVRLNKRLRGMLSDDNDRVVNGYYFETYPEDEAPMRVLLESVNRCLAEEKCFTPSSLGSEKILRQGSLYKFYLEWIAEEANLEKKREYIERLGERIEFKLRRFEVRHNKSARWANDGALVISLDGSAFGEERQKLAPYFETPWSVLGNAVRIEWEKADPAKNIFEILYSGTVGERAYVSPSENQMQLYAQTSTRAMAHEFGHILGFRDRYFTVWHEDSCEYEDFFLEDDIMSDHTIGTVLPEHWLKLQEIYPLTNP